MLEEFSPGLLTVSRRIAYPEGMSESNQTLLLASPDLDLVEWLLSDLGAERGGGRPTARFSGQELQFIVDGDGETAGEDATPDVLVGLVRFVDVLSLQRMGERLGGVPGRKTVPLAVLVYRNENESDFKMSCPYCGQKLWVRDADVDKRGRCPHCRKGFTLPRQEEHVQSTLKLPDSVPVLRIQRNDAGSLAGPLRRILSLRKESVLDNLDMKSQAANQTMNVDVEE
jgi:hypothetical protein